MIIQFKYFHDSQNFLLTLARGCESFSVKCVQFPLTFTELNLMKEIFSREP